MERTRGKLYKAGKRDEGFSKALRCAESVAASKGKREDRLAALRGLPTEDVEDDDSSAPCSPQCSPRTASSEQATGCSATEKGLSRLEKLRMWREEKKAAERERAKAQKPVFKVSHPAAVTAPSIVASSATTTVSAASNVPGTSAAPPVPGKVPCGNDSVVRSKAAIVSQRANAGSASGISAKPKGGRLHETTGSRQQVVTVGRPQVPAGGEKQVVTGGRQKALPGGRQQPAIVGRQQPVIDSRQHQASVQKQLPTAVGRQQHLASDRHPVTAEKQQPLATQTATRMHSVRPAGGLKAGSTVPSAATSKTSASSGVSKQGIAGSGASSRLPRAASGTKSAVVSAKVPAVKSAKVSATDEAATAVPISQPLPRRNSNGTGSIAVHNECAMDEGVLLPSLDIGTDEKPATRSFAPAFFQFKAPDGLRIPTPKGNRLLSEGNRDVSEWMADSGTVQAADGLSAVAATPSRLAQQTPCIKQSETSCARSKGTTPAREWRGRAALARLAKAVTPEEKMDILSRSPLVEMVRRTPKSCQRQSTSGLAVPDNVASPTVAPEVPLLFCLPEDDAPSDSYAAADSEETTVLDEKAREVRYFKDLVISQTQKLNDLSEKWNQVLATSDELVTDDVQGQIRTTIGQAQLLIAERFDQFSGLVGACELGTGEKITTTVDLHGFWDMIYIQVQDVLAKFAFLAELQARGYVPEEKPSTKRPATQKTSGKGRKRAAAAVAASASDKEASDPKDGPTKVAGKSKFALFKEQKQREQAAARAAEAALSANDGSSPSTSATVALEMPSPSASVLSSESQATGQPLLSPARPRSAVSLRRRSLAVNLPAAQERTGGAGAAAAAASPAACPPCMPSALPDLGCSPALLSAGVRPLQSALRDISNEKSAVSDRKAKKARFSEAVTSPANRRSTLHRTTPYRPRKSDLVPPSPGFLEDFTSVFSPDVVGEAGTPSSNLRRSTRLSMLKLEVSDSSDRSTMTPGTSSLVPRRRSSRMFRRSATPMRKSFSAIDDGADEDEQFASRFLVPTGSASTGGRRSRSHVGTPLPPVQSLTLDDCDLSAEVMPEMSPLLELTPTSPVEPRADLAAVPSDISDAASDALKMPPPPRRSLKRQSHARPRASWLIDLY